MMDTNTTDAEIAAPPGTSRGLRWFVGLVALTLLVTAAMFLSGAGTNPVSEPFTETEAAARLQTGSTIRTKTPSDADYVRALIGRWKRPESYGDITLTLKPEGRGTMYVEFSTVYSLLVDDELLVDIKWEVKDGRCVFQSIRGKPQAAFELVTKLKGKVRDQKIIEVTSKRAIFFDDKRKKTKKTWKRLPDANKK
ncbi:hypothetical protein [Thalassoroseus pseudoceratinae]|uniref:hypothetical protein n=1 Tax=Thalassoroseus pseudoceratinae TaxID=2713176 RepID=UPI00141ED1A3|nr:hypothetical protein [Thalassoroseus pseudoceratinae]